MTLSAKITSARPISELGRHRLGKRTPSSTLSIPSFWSAALLLFVLFANVSLAAQRELKGKTSEKVDAVLVLDNSGSMLVTDPLRLRDQGANLFTQFLKADDRLAIVQFAQTASIVRSLSPYDKDHADDVAQQITKLGPPGIYTNILAGVKLAKSMLDESPRADAQQIIVLLSDGKMEPDPATGQPAALTNELLNGFLPDLKAKGIKIYTVAFSNQADKELLASIALATEGVNWFTETAEKLHQSYADLFLAVKKPQMVPLTNKGFHVDDDVQEATFYISRDAGQELEILSPEGKKISYVNRGADIKWFRSDKFDVVTIATPTGGDWQLSGITPDEGFATILTNLKLTTDWPTTATAETPTVLQARLYEGDKPVALPEVSGVTHYGYQIIPTDQVSAPIVKGTMADDGKAGDKIAGDGIFSAEITIESPGEYKLRVVAQAPTFTRNQQLPFRVRPPLITLSVVTREEGGEEHSNKPTTTGEHAVGGGHGQGHGGDESAGEAQSAEKQEEATTEEHPADASKDEKTDEESGKEKPLESEHTDDYFVKGLSEEASQLKDIEVKCVAVAANRKRYTLPMAKVDDGHGAVRYEFPAAALPHDGIFSLQAFFSGLAKGKRVVKAATRIIRYKKVKKAGDEEAVRLVEAANAPEPEGFPWVGLISLIVLNCAAGSAGLYLIKKAQSGGQIEVPDFKIPAHVAASLASLKEQIEITEVDLTQPLFTDPNFEIAPSMDAGASSEASPDVNADETPTEAPPEETPPPEEEAKQ